MFTYIIHTRPRRSLWGCVYVCVCVCMWCVCCDLSKQVHILPFFVRVCVYVCVCCDFVAAHSQRVQNIHTHTHTRAALCRSH